jgi:hypothetical protein
MKNVYSLIRGSSLFRNYRPGESGYLIGTLERVAAVTSPFQRSAITQLANGSNPSANLPPGHFGEVEELLKNLDAYGFLNHSQSELTPPKRYLDEVDSHDRAAIQLRARSAPELAQIEWAEVDRVDQRRDGGTSTLAARSQFLIELSGRSRVLTILYSILLASGVSRVRFADRHFKSEVSDLDIGAGALTSKDLGLNYYQQLENQRRGQSLFPISLGENFDGDIAPAALIIHYGDCDPELLIEWSQRKVPHFLIHQPVGDEILLGPLVLPGESPCNRCLSLYEIDNWGFTRFERIALTPVDDLPMAIAHYIAAVVASEVLRFIDGAPTSGGEVLYLNYQRLTSPQVVAIARHPLCGCEVR